MKRRLGISPRLLSLFLILLLLLPSLVACGGASSGGLSDSSGDGTTALPDESGALLRLVENGATAYTIICAEGASDAVKTKSLELQQTLSSYTGVTFRISTDLYNHYEETLPERACEILIGATNRPVTAELRELIGKNEYVIAEKNDRIVLMGYSDEDTLAAVEYFISHYLTLDQNVEIREGSQYLGTFTYHLGSITIDGVSIEEYSVVVPKSPKTLFPYYAALNLIDYLKIEAGVTLPLVYDDEAESDYELVIGETQRAESKTLSRLPLEDRQFVLKKVGGSVYLYGKDYMVGGAVSEFVNGYLEAEAGGDPIDVTGLPQSSLTKTFSFPRTATSALLLIGDGMGQSHIDSTFVSRKGYFLAEYLDNVGKCTTYPYGSSASSTKYTDSAASATALATGYKTKNSYLGLNHLGEPILNVRELASSVGAKTAVLTSDVITGATPAGFLCHHSSRKDTSVLQSQIDLELSSDPNLLYAESVNDDKDALLSETREILYALAHGNGTYFAMIEEAYIDKRSHDNDAEGMQECVLRYNDVIGYCIEFVMLHPDTALVITADHECGGLTLNDDGSFSYTSGNHTNAKVPVYTLGPETEQFKNATVDNTDVGKFLGSIFTDKQFGDPSLGG